MLTFGRLWEIVSDDPQAEEQDDPLMTSGEEDQAMEAIRSGLHVRKEGCGDFWDDFISVCGNADAMSSLLEVPREKVTGWAGKIRDLVEKANKKDSDHKSSSKKAEMIPTGEMPDTFGNDANADLRPSPS